MSESVSVTYPSCADVCAAVWEALNKNGLGVSDGAHMHSENNRAN